MNPKIFLFILVVCFTASTKRHPFKFAAAGDNNTISSDAYRIKFKDTCIKKYNDPTGTIENCTYEPSPGNTVKGVCAWNSIGWTCQGN